MSPSRYAEALEPTLAWLAIEHRGWGAVVAPPTEQREIAECLASLSPGRPVIELGANASPEWHAEAVNGTKSRTTVAGGFVILAPGLDDKTRAPVLSMLNQQRDRTSDRGVWVLIVSASELAHVRRHARDLASVLRSVDIVKFIPRTLTDDELIAARAELHTYYQRRFGRLDLRGFIRSEQEDVSFAVEDIFQPLEATAALPAPIGVSPLRSLPPGMTTTARGAKDAPARVLRRHLLVDHLAAWQRGVALIVGAPGSGKSFFLRWCALEGSREGELLGIQNPLPLYVPLAVTRVTPALPPLEDHVVEIFLDTGLQIAHAIASEAAAGRVIFLLDGLDEVGAARQEIADGASALSARYPSSRVIVTSRPTGLDGCQFDAEELMIEGLGDNAIRALLTAWCGLYEIQRVGAHGEARGRAEGARLAAEVLALPTLHELARSPLLATIIAIVHRAGVRLPDHRVELYDHIVRILVERWNQLRSRDADISGPSVRTPDAIRLLGPVALEMIASGQEGAIDELSLRDLIAKQLGRGSIRGVLDADAALGMFRESLGILVEQAPGIYSFLHKTLGEFLSAHEVVRTRQFETLIAKPETCTDPAWREVILLSLGVIGTLRADDERLAGAVATIVGVVHRRRDLARSDNADLLGSILADDPALSRQDAETLVQELIPFWWLDRAGGTAALGRVAKGPWRELAVRELKQCYRRGLRSAYARSGALLPIGTLFTLAQFGLPLDHLISELLVALATGSDAGGGGMLGFSAHFEQDQAGFVRVPVEHLPLVRALAKGRAIALVTLIATNDTTHEQLAPTWTGTALAACPSLAGISGVAVRVDLDAGHGALLPDLLDAWREVAALYPDAPQPPASVEEAIAIYGPPPAAAG